MNTTNYARLNNGKLEIHTDYFDGETSTSFEGKTFEINGEDLMTIYALLNDKEITYLLNFRESGSVNTIHHYMVVGENVENKRVIEEYVELLKEVEKINSTRHWWERKIKIDREL